MKGKASRRVYPRLWTIMILLLGLFVLLALIQPAAADDSQGWVSKYAGYADSCTSISAVDADTAWGVGYNWGTGYDGFIIKTTDGGENWTVDTFEGISFFDVFAVDADTAWAVGFDFPQDAGAIYKTTDGGETWQAQTSGKSMHIGGISAIDSQTAWAAGYTGTSQEGTILKTTDGGATWTEQNPGLNLNLYEVEAVDEDNVWVVGKGADYKGIILKTDDGGSTWDVQNSGTENDFRCLSALDADTAWAVGISGTILKTTDGGATWNSQDLHNNSHLFGVMAIDPNIVWAVGRDFESSGEIGVIYKTTDGGITWRLQAPSGKIPSLNAVSAIDGDIAWTVGYYCKILRTTDGGGEPLPFIWSVDPDSGFAGDEITITGLDFGSEQGSSQVEFGSHSATEYVSWSDSTIVCKVPAMPPGNVLVEVITPRGESLEAEFLARVPDPTVTSVFLPFGFTNTTCTVHLNGTNFWEGASAWMVNYEPDWVIPAAYISVESNTHIICTFHLHNVPPGQYDVMVRNADGGQGGLEDGFNVISCGTGSGTAVLAFGFTTGLLGFAGWTRRRRRKK